MGVGLAVAILIDATIVRAVLLSASMKLLGAGLPPFWDMMSLRMSPETYLSLPLIDEHSVRVQAGLQETWTTLIDVMERSRDDRTRARVASLLGCEPSRSDGVPLGSAGATLPGFRVGSVEPPVRLDLVGRHRFSSYALLYRLDELPDGAVQLPAQTRAEFPGLRGRIYRGLVIGTRMHVLAVRGPLGAVERRAPLRPAAATAGDGAA